MKNNILQHLPDTALPEAVAALEREFAQLKLGSQRPTAFDTAVSKVSFSIGPPISHKPIGHVVTARLYSLEGSPILFGLPLMSLLWADAGNPSEYNLFPSNPDGDDVWIASGQYNYGNILDFTYWPSYSRNDDSDLWAVAAIQRRDWGAIGINEADNNPDGATTGTVSLDMYVMWRFLRQGLGS